MRSSRGLHASTLSLLQLTSIHPHRPPPPPPPQKSTTKYGNEHEAIAVFSMMRAVQKFCPIFTLCVGNAFGEAALLLSAGTKVRAALV
jgi:hypothetical protein